MDKYFPHHFQVEKNEKLQITSLRDAVGMLKLYGQVNNYADQSTGGTTGGNRRSRISSEECDVAAEM